MSTDSVTTAAQQRLPTQVQPESPFTALPVVQSTVTSAPQSFGQDMPLSDSPSRPPPEAFKFASDSTLQVKPIGAPLERSLSTAERWGITLDRVVKGIVSIRFTILRTFERSFPGQASATGFVVDRTRGIILSNRHVVNPGPITATALFNKYEEIPIEPLYADPVHDFGFFKFDPADLKFAALEEIELYPEGAKVGLDIKVCGNDGGEQRSVLSGTLSRLDRGCPHSSDFNTFYIQAASGTSAGSSGSPVLDLQGRAVALNAAGATNSASDFYLPLDKVQRALKLLQQGKPISRGTLQTEFRHLSYEYLKKLGLPEAIEKESRRRHVDGTGLLTVSGVVPEGPGYLAGLQVGDILLKLEHPVYGERYVNNFYSVWDVLDEIVDQRITMTVCRGTELLTIEARVQDLHSIIPNEFFEVGAGIIHPVSYQVAKHNNMPCRGLVVVQGGTLWQVNTPFILTQFDGREVSTISEFIEIVRAIPDKKKVMFKYRAFGSWQENLILTEMEHHFFGMTYFKRTGMAWDRQLVRLAATENLSDFPKTFDVERELTWSEELRRNLVLGSSSGGCYGTGVLVGLRPIPMIVVSRDIVPVSLCDLEIGICNRRIPGTLIYLGLIAVVTVDKDLLHAGLTAPRFSDRILKIGDEIEDFGLDAAEQLNRKKTHIKDIGSVGSLVPIPPRWAMRNIEGIYIQEYMPSKGGVFIDPEDKSIVALSLSVNYQGNVGISYPFYVRPIIAALERGETIMPRSAGWSFFPSNLAGCLELGLREERAIRMVKLAKAQNALPRPISICARLRPLPNDGRDTLQIGDILIEIQ